MTTETGGKSSPNASPAATMSDVVGDRIRATRKRRGWSAQKLADQLAAAGAPELSMFVISNIESGRRKADGKRRREVSVDELFLIAYVLGVPPVHLLVPDEDSETPVEVAPGARVDGPNLMLRWIRGDQTLPGVDPRGFFAATLEHVQAPDGQQTLAEYTRNVLQNQAREIVGQLNAQTKELADQAAQRVSSLAERLDQAISSGATGEELQALLREVQKNE
ncbi:MAG TPA: helix-turn-helix transcriptional regulator [Actinospica sp.]|nr:helix-turn-helix transcriptional regulator [Actinospica sp.]